MFAPVGPVASTAVPSPQSKNVTRRFQLGPVIGRGSFGIVYEAFDQELRRKVAIKAAYGATAGREADLFLREARAASRLRHANIVTVHDVVKTKEGVFIVSDLIRGETLRLWLDHHTCSIDKCVELVIEICEAMEYAHRNGVIHRDLKPGNIVMDEQGVPHILDFGLSKSLDNQADSICQNGVPIGTPAFMAPEQVRGQREKIDRRSDVYAIGVILFQMLSGRLPFVGQRDELYRQVLTQPPESLLKHAKVPRSLNAICLKALAKSPEDRYQWASEMAEDLRRFLDRRMVHAYGRVDGRVAAGWTRRYLLVSVVMTLAGVAGVFGYWKYQDWRASHPMVPVLVKTVPEGAAMVWQRFDLETGLPDPESGIESVAGQWVRLPPGFYRIKVQSGNEYTEVFRTIPAEQQEAASQVYSFHGHNVFLPHRSSERAQGQVVLPEIQIVPVADVSADLAFLPAGKLEIMADREVLPLFSGLSTEVSSCLMTTQETTWGEMKQHWPEITIPSTAKADQAVEGIFWDVALAYAESRGMSLPSVVELRHAASNAGTTRFPAGNLESEPDAPSYPVGEVQDWDITQNRVPIRGLLTGVPEWTQDPFQFLRRVEGQLEPVKLPALAGVTPDATAFPARWYVVGLPRDQPTRWSVEYRLSSAENANATNQRIGFRMVRRLAQ